MATNVAREVAALARMTASDLRARYAEVFGEPTRTGNRTWLVRRIAWRIQALAEGDLSERARARAAELARDADLRVIPPRGRAEPANLRVVVPETGFVSDDRLPPPGSVITRAYKGTTIHVKVLATGFEYDGHTFPSLTPREQGRVIDLLVERVDYDGAAGTVAVTFRPTGIKALSAEMRETEPQPRGKRA